MSKLYRTTLIITHTTISTGMSPSWESEHAHIKKLKSL